MVNLLNDSGSTAFRFPVVHWHSYQHIRFGARDRCRGFLYVSRDSIRYDPVFSTEEKYKKDAFGIAPSEVQKAYPCFNASCGTSVQLLLSDRNYGFYFLPYRAGQVPQNERELEASLGSKSDISEFLLLATRDFEAAVRKFQLLAAGLQKSAAAQSTGGAVPVPAEPVAPNTAILRVTAQPGGVQVYLDDQFKGITSSDEGLLVIGDLKPGSYRIRLTQPGYKDWTSSVSVASGEEEKIAAKLIPAGPRPLSVDEVEEALRNGISNKRVMEFVGQFGVDFALTDDIEQRLRAVGADDTLLLAITKTKK